MKVVIAAILGVLMLGACAAEKTNEVPAGTKANTTTATDRSHTAATPTVAPIVDESVSIAPAVQTTSENQESGTWAGQIKVAQSVSMFNYVGAESGDFAPMRFRNDSEGGRKILAACSHDDMCEFTGMIEWLDEAPPPDASAIGQIVRVDTVKRLPAGAS